MDFAVDVEVTPEACTMAAKASVPRKLPISVAAQAISMSLTPVRPDNTPTNMIITVEVNSCAPANITSVSAIGKTAPSSSFTPAECSATNGDTATSNSTSPTAMNAPASMADTRNRPGLRSSSALCTAWSTVLATFSATVFTITTLEAARFPQHGPMSRIPGRPLVTVYRCELRNPRKAAARGRGNRKG
ncbi:hypothetical protein GCM10027167_57310 [Nocardia heshunensis]